MMKIAWKYNINCNLQDMIRNLVIFNISIFAKLFLFCSKLARKGETAQPACKKETPFCKIEMFKNNVFAALRNCYVVVR